MGKHKILSSKRIFDQAKIQVDELEIKLPNQQMTNWCVISWPNLYFAAPIKNDKVLMTREWRPGPATLVTQFTGARALFDNENDNLKELIREQEEELGLVGGNYEKILQVSNGPHITGFKVIYVVTNFKKGKTNRDQNEFQEILELPIKGLYNELVKNHVISAETLLAAKILEEKFN